LDVLVSRHGTCHTRTLVRREEAATALDVRSLEESFELIAPKGDEFMRRFYDRLFEVAPDVRPLFAEVDMERQRRALLNMLVVIHESLQDLDDVVPELEALGARHVEWGALPDHYPVVGEVLIGEMAALAGDAWKPEYTAAWQEAYGVLQDVMLSGAAAAAR
jgi:nitric oxide dioxygenase